MYGNLRAMSIIAKVLGRSSQTTGNSMSWRTVPTIVARRARRFSQSRLASVYAGPGAAQLNIEPSLPMRQFLSELNPLLRSRPHPKIAILVKAEPSRVAQLIRSAHRHITLVEIHDEDGLLHVELAARGPFDLIVDDVRHRSDPAGSFTSMLFHLRKGGTLALTRFNPGLAEPTGLWPLLVRLVALRAKQSGTQAKNHDEEQLARATMRVVVNGKSLLAGNATRSYAKIREVEIDRVLEIRGPRAGGVLEQRPPGRLFPRSVVRDHDELSRLRQQEPIYVPALSLREYHDVTCAPGQVVIQKNLLLPDTYRHNLYPRLTNRMTTEVGHGFATVKSHIHGVKMDLRDAEPLSGTYFHLDAEWPGHFGHVMTEQMSRLWGWSSAKQRFPDLKVLIGQRPRESGLMPFERWILEAAGVPTDDVLLMTRPVRVKTLVSATPMLSMPQYVSPQIEPVWQEIGRRLEAQSDVGTQSTPRRIFCGRKRSTRWCHNQGDVEKVFANAGFEVIYPETMPLPVQASLFRNAEVIGGYAGSALFTSCLVAQPKRLLIVSSQSYTANNEYLIAGVLGHEVDVFWSVPDKQHFSSGYTFNFDREGQHLRRVLNELD